MADTFSLEVATPERLVFREAATEAQIPAKSGYIGILPGHAPLLTELGVGYASYVSEGRTFYFALHGGFIEVLPDKVRVLARTLEKADEIDVRRAEAAFRRAQEELSSPRARLSISPTSQVTSKSSNCCRAKLKTWRIVRIFFMTPGSR